MRESKYVLLMNSVTDTYQLYRNSMHVLLMSHSADTCHLYMDSAMRSLHFQAAVDLPVWSNRMIRPHRRQGYRWLSQCTGTLPCTAPGIGFRL